ncbi:cobalamin B12-binding domain-containing protein [Amycolatopsis pretoriensis]|nr:cobalamin-dependent protein [Amycolatopsis pretoriensis]
MEFESWRYCRATANSASAPVTDGSAPAGLRVVVTSTASDSHTWNLIYLQLLLEELGNHVINFGPCVPDQVLVDRCRALRPDLIVMSSVNGHGVQDGIGAISLIRSAPELTSTPVVIGGKLGVAGPDGGESARRLAAAGFDAVFHDGDDIAVFRAFVDALPAPRRELRR